MAEEVEVPTDRAQGSFVPITQPIVPRKAQAKRHYGSHPYFTKRAWNVVQEYIRQFSAPGDLVLDPFGGSGVTAVEALALGRRAIHVDLAPLANLLTWGVAVSPIDMQVFQETFHEIRESCEDQIQALYKMSAEEIDAMEVPCWYPRDVPLPPNSDVPTVEACFHRRSLIALSILLHHIKEIQDETIRDLYRLIFSATLNKTNLTFSSTTGRKESRGDSGIFRVYRYWVPEKTIELNVWEQFALRQKGWVNAKRETNAVIGDKFRLGDTIRIVQHTATNLKDVVDTESIDYIYTDPPYGAHIAYLDLMTMWNAWLELDVSAEDRQLEVIQGGSLGKSKESYVDLLGESIGEMFRVLKWDAWLSIVFAHKDTALWDAIVKAAQHAGFQYVNTAVQPSKTPSLHKRKNPLKVLSGELVLNFQKVRNPRSIAISAMGSDVVRLIKNTAEVVIVRGNGASTELIYNDLIPVLLENGLLSEVQKSIPNIPDLLHEEFDYIAEEWRIRENKKLGSFVPLGDRIKFYLIDYLKRLERENRNTTFDEIIFNVMPNLINGKQPTQHSILEVLTQIAYSPDGLHWHLHEERVDAPGQLGMTFTGVHAIPILVDPKEDVAHDELIYRLSKLAIGAGLIPHVGKKEQANSVNGEKLGQFAGGSLPRSILDAEKRWTVGKIEQIDCTFFDPTGVPIFAFEVEGSTPITTGIDRFLELLKVNPELAHRLVIVIPRDRERHFTRIIRDSHYIGHPMYMENKIVWLYYDDLIKLYNKFAGKSPPSWIVLQKQLESAVRHPKMERD